MTKTIKSMTSIAQLQYFEEIRSIAMLSIKKTKNPIVGACYSEVVRNAYTSCQQVHVIHCKFAFLDKLIS